MLRTTTNPLVYSSSLAPFSKNVETSSMQKLPELTGIASYSPTKTKKASNLFNKNNCSSSVDLKEKLKEVKKKSLLILKAQLVESEPLPTTTKKKNVLILNESVRRFSLKDSLNNWSNNENHEYLSEMMQGIRFPQDNMNNNGSIRKKVTNLTQLRNHELFAPCQGKKLQKQNKSVTSQTMPILKSAQYKFKKSNGFRRSININMPIQFQGEIMSNNDTYHKFNEDIYSPLKSRPILTPTPPPLITPITTNKFNQTKGQKDSSPLNSAHQSQLNLGNAKEQHDLNNTNIPHNNDNLNLQHHHRHHHHHHNNSHNEKDSCRHGLISTSSSFMKLRGIPDNHNEARDNQTLHYQTQNSSVSLSNIFNSRAQLHAYSNKLMSSDLGQEFHSIETTIGIFNNSNNNQLNDYHGFNLSPNPVNPLWNPPTYKPITIEILKIKLGEDATIEKLKWSNIRRKLVHVLNYFKLLKLKIHQIMDKPNIFPKKSHEHFCSIKFLAAAKFGDFEKIMIFLTSYGLDILHSINHIQQTALHRASSAGHLEIVKVLINYGADVNARDFVGRTPLYYALESKRCEVVQYLLYARCDPWSPVQYRYKTLCSDNSTITYYLTKARKLHFQLQMSKPSERELIWESTRGDLIKSIDFNEAKFGNNKGYQNNHVTNMKNQYQY